jgi:hypothetical protein
VYGCSGAAATGAVGVVLSEHAEATNVTASSTALT